MRKCLLSVVALIVISVGCSRNFLKIEPQANVVRLTIYRSVSNWPDPSLIILARDVNFNYNERIITIKGLVSIVGDGSLYCEDGVTGDEWVVPEIKIQDDALIINIPNDASYNVYIGKQHHYLSVVK